MFRLLVIFTLIIYLGINLTVGVLENGIHMADYPPSGESALLMERIKGGKITKNGVVAALLELCRSGELVIKKTGNDYELMLVNEYKGPDRYKREILDRLFKNINDNNVNEDAIITYPTIKLNNDGELGRIAKEIADSINDEYRPRKQWVKPNWILAKLWKSSSVVVLEVVLLPFSTGSSEQVVMSLVLALFFYKSFDMLVDDSDKSVKLFSYIWFFAVFAISTNMIAGNDSAILWYLISFAAILGTYFINFKRKVDVNYLRERKVLKGFLKSLRNKKAQKEAKKYINKTDDKFYEVLPYMFAIGKQNKWIDSYSDCQFEKPDWFMCDQEFDQSTLKECMDTLVMSTK